MGFLNPVYFMVILLSVYLMFHAVKALQFSRLPLLTLAVRHVRKSKWVKP